MLHCKLKKKYTGVKKRASNTFVRYIYIYTFVYTSTVYTRSVFSALMNLKQLQRKQKYCRLNTYILCFAILLIMDFLGWQTPSCTCVLYL